MSTRTYNLRTRAEVIQPQAPSQVQNELTPRQFSVSPLRDPPPHMSARPGNPTLLYSEVVASRSLSPVKGNSSATAAHPEGGSEVERFPIGPLQRDTRVVPTVSRENILPVEGNTSSGVNNSPEDPGEDTWTTVKRRRARSLESFELIRKGLTKEQAQTVKAAAETLTKSQKETLSHRQRKVAHRRTDSSSSREEGPSKTKGKKY